MKKVIIIFCLAFYAFFGYGQLLKPVRLDSCVAVLLPHDFQKSDIKGDQTFSGKASNGFIIVTRTINPSSNVMLTKEKDLNKVLKAYVNQIKQSSPGNNILNDHDTIVNNLEVRDFTLQTDTGDGVQLRKFRILYTKGITYTFDYAYTQASAEVAKKEMDKFFNSIIISPELNGTVQFTMWGKHAGLSVVAWIAIAVGVILITFLVLFIRKRRRGDMIVNDVLE